MAAWYGKGDILLNEGKFAEFIDCYKKSIELDSSDASVWYSKACGEIMLGQTDIDINNLEKSIELGGIEYKEAAKEDEYMDSVKTSQRFINLVT